jgi:hypothetical protein
MSKQIIVVGMDVPGDIEVEDVGYGSRRSLLDADIVLFSPDISEFTSTNETFQGKKSLSDDDSFRLKEATAHWRNEILLATQAGKTVFVFAGHCESVFVDTGRREYSGTGRSRMTNRIVEEHNPYSSIPAALGAVVHSPGARMKTAPGAESISAYWREFAKYTKYEVYFDGIKAKPLLLTQHGEKIVGALVTSKSGGFVVMLPRPDLNELASELEETMPREGDGKNEGDPVGDIAASAEELETADEEEAPEDGESEAGVHVWSASETAAGSKFISAIVEIDRTLRASQARTPAPEWAKNNRYELNEELRVRSEADRLDQQIRELEDARARLREELTAAGNLRGLLFETGHHLEDAIIEALRILGFTAERFREGGSEFDVVFVSPEGGRFIGEAEGKDAKAVNIDKMDQLERNIREEFANREGTDYAMGVLFGNANRLTAPSERGDYFTAKCMAAAARSGVALVRTPDLFDPARHLKEHPDEEFARRCRAAILAASGAIVQFPEIPAGADTGNGGLPVPS